MFGVFIVIICGLFWDGLCFGIFRYWVSGFVLPLLVPGVSVPLSRQVNQVQLCLPPVCDFPVSLCVFIVCVCLCSLSSVLLYITPSSSPVFLRESTVCSPCCPPFVFRFVIL